MGYFNIYGQYISDGNELYHHGILGMRWGHKNGPPYPIGAGGHSASEEKAGWKKSLSSASEAVKSGARKTAGAAKAGARGAIKGTKRAVKELDNARLKRAEVNSRKVKRNKLNASVKRMSDDELNARIRRIENEDKYKKLIGVKTQSQISEDRRNKGKSIVDKTLTSLGDNVLVPMATGWAVYKLKDYTYNKYGGEYKPDRMYEVFNKVGANPSLYKPKNKN